MSPYLAEVAESNEPCDTSFTSDKYSHYLGSEYRSCLNELYSLRDAILVAMYKVGFKRTDDFTIRKLRTLATNDSKGSARLVFESMFDTSEDALIDQMSLYRSVAQHCLGLNNPVFGDVYRLRVSEGPFGEIPYMVYPLYDNLSVMREIERGSSKGILVPVTDSEFDRFIQLPRHRDALEFCFDCFERLLRIAELLADEIGFSPRLTTLTEDHILAATLTRDGEILKFERDKETNQLKPVA